MVEVAHPREITVGSPEFSRTIGTISGNKGGESIFFRPVKDLAPWENWGDKKRRILPRLLEGLPLRDNKKIALGESGYAPSEVHDAIQPLFPRIQYPSLSEIAIDSQFFLIDPGTGLVGRVSSTPNLKGAIDDLRHQTSLGEGHIDGAPSTGLILVAAQRGAKDSFVLRYTKVTGNGEPTLTPEESDGIFDNLPVEEKVSYDANGRLGTFRKSHLPDGALTADEPISPSRIGQFKTADGEKIDVIEVLMRLKAQHNAEKYLQRAAEQQTNRLNRQLGRSRRGPLSLFRR